MALLSVLRKIEGRCSLDKGASQEAIYDRIRKKVAIRLKN